MPITARAFQFFFATILVHGTFFTVTAGAAQRQQQQLRLELRATVAQPGRPMHHSTTDTPGNSQPSDMGARLDRSATSTARRKDGTLGSQGLQSRDKVHIVVVQVRHTLFVSCQAGLLATRSAVRMAPNTS